MQTKHYGKRLVSLFSALALTVALAVPSVRAASTSESYTSANATLFQYTDSGVSVTEGPYNGYAVDGTNVTIHASGVYVFSGSCTDGSITVKKGTQDVTIVLNGLSLTSSDTAPISCNKSTEVTILANGGTTNTLTDAAANNEETDPDNTSAENAVIKSKDGSQLTIGGSGTLILNANGKNGIKSGATTDEDGTASLTIQNLTLQISAPVNDGINAGSDLSIPSGTITISASDDGIHSDYVLNIGTKGSSVGPSITVTKSTEGLEGAIVNLYAGTVEIHASDDGINAANADLSGYSFALNVLGGTIYVDAQGDGLDSNGTLNISGGTVQIYSSSQGDNAPLDDETGFTLSGGTVLAVGNSGMAEVPTMVSQAYVTFGSSGMGGGQGGMRPSGTAPTGNQASGTGTQQAPAKPSGVQSSTQQQSSATGTAITISADTAIAVKDSNGTSLVTGTGIRSANYVFFSSDSLTSGSTYSLALSGSSVAQATATTQAGTAMGPGGSGTPGTSAGGTSAGSDGTSGTAAGSASDNLPFADVQQSNWYYQAIQYTYGRSWMTGISSDSFSPDTNMTVGQLLTVLYRLGVQNGLWQDSYSTTGSNWLEGASYAAKALSVSDSLIASATREQMVELMYQFAKASNQVSETTAALSSQYTDAGDVSDTEAFAWALNNGVINGMSSTTLSPKSNMTRAQLSTVLMRYAEAVGTQN